MLIWHPVKQKIFLFYETNPTVLSFIYSKDLSISRPVKESLDANKLKVRVLNMVGMLQCLKTTTPTRKHLNLFYIIDALASLSDWLTYQNSKVLPERGQGIEPNLASIGKKYYKIRAITYKWTPAKQTVTVFLNNRPKKVKITSD